MKCRLGILVLLPLMFFLGGCSWMHEFILANKSGHDLNVSYRLTEVSREGVFHQFPGMRTNNQLDTIPHTFDRVTNTVSFILPAGKEVIIGNAMNTSFDNYKNDPKQFNLAEIRTDGKFTRLTPAEIIQQTKAKKPGKATLELY